MPARRTLQRRILILGVIIIVAACIATSDALHGWTEDLLSFADHAITRFPLWGMLLFVLLAMVSAMLAFFSSAVLVPIGVYTWGAAVCVVLLWIGWFLGGMLAFAIGKYLGRPFASRLIGEARFFGFEQRVSGQLRFIDVLIFQLTLPSEIPGYVLGAVRCRFPLYVVSLALAELPYAVGTVFLGAMYLQRKSTLLLLLGLGAVALSVVAYRIYRSASRPSRY